MLTNDLEEIFLFSKREARTEAFVLDMEELVGGGEAIFHPNIPWICVFYAPLKIIKRLRVDIL